MSGESGHASKPHARVPLDLGRLRTLRLQKGWSQHELSLRIGVQGAPAVSAWERGLSVPHPQKLQRLAQVLGVEPVELLAREPGALGFRELRVTRGLSRRALASASMVSLTTARRWEAGQFQTMPGPSVLRAVAAALKVPLPRLIAALEMSRRAVDGA